MLSAPTQTWKLRHHAGLTLMEMVVTLALISILAAVALPLSEMTVKRSKEMELKRSLRMMRTAIDAYKADFDKAVEKKTIIPSINDTGYPESLEVLTEGHDWGGLYSFKRRYLRRLPVDPFDQFDEGWGVRSSQDAPDSVVSGEEDVFDVYSQSEEIALDGTTYNQW